MTWTESQRSGMLYTVLIHAAILLFLLMITLSGDIKFQSEEGLLVDFGYSDTGKGDEEPSAVYSKNDNIYKAPIQANQKASAPESKTFKQKEIKAEDLLTQEHEPSVALHTAKAEKKIVEKKKPDPNL